MEISKGLGAGKSLKRKPAAQHALPRLQPILGNIEFRRALVLERARTDRSEQEFSLLLLEGGALSSLGVSEQVIHELSGRIRTTDDIGWFDHRRLAVLLPCTTSPGAFTVAKNIQHIARRFSLRLIAYTYPGQWLPEDAGSRDVDDGSGAVIGSIDSL